MSVFRDAEIEYLGSQRLGRLATVGRDGMPHVVPVAFRYNSETDTIDIGGHDFAKRKKFRDVDANFDHIENYAGFGYRWTAEG